jgi:pimeloyl-ACP methyl ester carboxylesterase
MRFSAEVEAWRARGRVLQARNLGVFVVDEGERDATPLLVLHGFPTSSYDFQHVWPALTKSRRTVTLDFPGFGFSDKPADFSYSLFEQADIVEMVARELGLGRVDLWAHDMGTSVATELLSRRAAKLLSFEIDRLILMNGSVHAEMAHLTPGQKLLRRPLIGPLFARAVNLTTYRLQLKRVLARPVAPSEIDDQFALMKHKDGNLRMPAIIHYYDERLRFRRRWIGALETFDGEALILWGARDPVAVMAIGEQLARETPHARLVRLDGVGHYPQLEAPDEVVAQVTQFLQR